MPAGSESGRRLGTAVLAYLVTVTLLITWAPFDFAMRPQHGLTALWKWSDLVLNVVMFVPLGFFARSIAARRAPVASWSWWTIGLLGAALSAVIEGGQLFLASRFTSLFDVATNGLGAAVGARLYDVARPRLRVGAGAVTALALDLPLTGLVMLLVPLLWVAGFGSGDSARIWLTLPVALFGGAIMGAVHGAYLHAVSPQASPPRGRAGLAAVVAGWYVMASLPGVAARWDVLVAGATLAVGMALLRSHAAARARARDGAQRVELPTLRLVLPFLAVYLTLSALWPLTAVSDTWVGGWTLAPATDDLSRRLLMQSLEYLAAFTLVGYITAELHGRDNARYATVWPRVLRPVTTLVLLLEFARGWNTAIGASGVLSLLAIGAGLFGGWLYHLQRDHVRTLRERPDAPSLVVMSRTLPLRRLLPRPRRRVAPRVHS
jgi:VanZ family protein